MLPEGRTRGRFRQAGSNSTSASTSAEIDPEFDFDFDPKIRLRPQNSTSTPKIDFDPLLKDPCQRLISFRNRGRWRSGLEIVERCTAAQTWTSGSPLAQAHAELGRSTILGTCHVGRQPEFVGFCGPGGPGGPFPTGGASKPFRPSRFASGCVQKHLLKDPGVLLKDPATRPRRR